MSCKAMDTSCWIRIGTGSALRFYVSSGCGEWSVIDSLDKSLHGIAVYNPDLLSRRELLEQFVARHSLLARLIEDLRAPRPQHKLLVGTRGMGKTTLLRRLRYSIEDDPELNDRWLPLVFPEEQYNVARLADLYINCIDALGDVLEESGKAQEAVKLDQFTERLVSGDPEGLAIEARD